VGVDGGRLGGKRGWSRGVDGGRLWGGGVDGHHRKPDDVLHAREYMCKL
jgi:hypothetical protein